MNRIRCPGCDKELKNLNYGKSSISEFWCDKCKLEITIDDHNYEYEVNERSEDERL